MTFDDILEQVIAVLKRQGRVSYPALKLRFSLDDEYLGVHSQRELERVQQRQRKQAEHQMEVASEVDAKVAKLNRRGQDTRGVASHAARAWRHAERLFDEAVQSAEVVEQVKAALVWFDADGHLLSRGEAQEQLDKASAKLSGSQWSKVRRMLRDARTLSHLDRLEKELAEVVPKPMLRESLTRLWCFSRRLAQAKDEEVGRLGSLVTMKQVLCDRLCPQWHDAYREVDERLRHAVRASSAVEGVNSVVRMHQGRHRHVSQEMLDLKRLYWNCPHSPGFCGRPSENEHVTSGKTIR
jgi:hypothetical protein